MVNINEEDKLLHTLQTVGRLSNKAARRVYSNIILHLGTIKADNLKSYIRNIVQFLQLTNRHAINNEVHANEIHSNEVYTNEIHTNEVNSKVSTSNAITKKLN